MGFEPVTSCSASKRSVLTELCTHILKTITSTYPVWIGVGFLSLFFQQRFVVASRTPKIGFEPTYRPFGAIPDLESGELPNCPTSA